MDKKVIEIDNLEKTEDDVKAEAKPAGIQWLSSQPS